MNPDASIIESFSRNLVRIPAEHNLTATFLAQGAFNKVYTIATSGGDGVESQLPYVFRVTLPVEPFYKTAGEVAILLYSRSQNRPYPTCHHAQFHGKQRAWLRTDPRGQNSWCLSEKLVARDGYGDKGERDEGGCSVRQTAPRPTFL